MAVAAVVAALGEGAVEERVTGGDQPVHLTTTLLVHIVSGRGLVAGPFLPLPLPGRLVQVGWVGEQREVPTKVPRGRVMQSQGRWVKRQEEGHLLLLLVSKAEEGEEEDRYQVRQLVKLP